MTEPSRGVAALLLGLLALATACGPDPTPSAVPGPGPTVLVPVTPTTPDPPGQVYRPTGTGGIVCRGLAADPCDRAEADVMIGYTDTVTADLGSSVGVHTEVARLRLLEGATLHLLKRSDGTGIQLFLLDLGAALFNHPSEGGEFVVQARDTLIQPVDTQFSVAVQRNGSVKVAVYDGAVGVVITSSSGIRLELGRQQQVEVAPGGSISPPAALDAETLSQWRTFGNGADVDVDRGVLNLAACPALPANQLYPEAPVAVLARLLCPVEDAQRYSPNDLVRSWIRHFAGGDLLYEQPRDTVYALFTGDHTWQAYTLGAANPDDLVSGRPALRDQLGDLSAACDGETWAVQRFAAGTVLSPYPGAGCAGAPHAGRVLYQDGTWADGPPAPPPPSNTPAPPANTRVPRRPTATPGLPSATRAPTSTQSAIPADHTPPVIDKVGADPNTVYVGPQCERRPEDPLVWAYVSDASRLKEVVLYYAYRYNTCTQTCDSLPGVFTQSCIDKIADGQPTPMTYNRDTGRYEALIPRGTVQGTIQFRIFATDAWGNSAESRPQLGTIPVILCCPAETPIPVE
ncbi:MAG TPA: hypothetical protein VM536_23550 [Chloroflexia bacterium]|nr:hypothetical protein [Chloroflexia bacterium]